MTETHGLWTDGYHAQVQRNIGLLTVEEQNRLKCSKVSIFGVGGLGGVILEILARSGIEYFSIVDNDVYESSNLNRQIFAFRDTIGSMKIAMAEEFCKRINPHIQMETFDCVDEHNCSDILAGSDVAALVLDDIKACLIVARTARQMGITFVEGWALPFANVCTFSPESATFEKTYGLTEVENQAVATISEERNRQLLMKLLLRFGQVEGVADYFSDEAVRNLAQGVAPSFAPMVWFTAVRLAIECIKVLLGWKDLALSPNFAIYDPFAHRIPQRLDRLPPSRESAVRQMVQGSKEA
jgi:molybdopterin/thiamine biosynthesis adenylyltransferase